MGLKSHHDALSVHNYETARKALEQAQLTPTGKRRTEKRFGFHLGVNRNHGVTWARECEEGAIAFRLYDTDVVTWYPDNSVEVDNFGTATTSVFARQFMPGGLHLSHPVERRGNCGGHHGFHYRVEDGSRWGESRICFGIGNLVRFREHGDTWLPDEDTLQTVKFPELDVKGARELSKRYPLRDFENWLAMAPMHMTNTTIEHDCWSYDDCVDALEKRDFILASMFLPLTTDTGAFGNTIKPIPIFVKNRDQHVTMASLRKLKLAMWEREGYLSSASFTTMKREDFDRRMVRVRELAALDMLSSYDYGPE